MHALYFVCHLENKSKYNCYAFFVIKLPFKVCLINFLGVAEITVGSTSPQLTFQQDEKQDILIVSYFNNNNSNNITNNHKQYLNIKDYSHENCLW